MRVRRGLARLLLLAAAAGAGWFAFVSWADRVDPVAALPGGAAGAVDLRGLEGIVASVEGTRFAAAFATSALRAWIEKAEAVRALDALREEARATLRLPLARRHLLDILGRHAAVAWYPNAGARDRTAPWVAACRLSTRAWAVARLLLLAERAGLGGSGLSAERIAGTEVVALPGGTSDHAWHAFLAGRLLVIGSDRGLVERAARCVGGTGPSLAAEPSWTAIRRELPEGDAYLWSRGGGGILPVPPGVPGAIPDAGAVGAVLRAGSTLEIHLLTPGTAPPPRPSDRGAGALPGLNLPGGAPLFLHASRGLPPPLFAELLASRRRLVSSRSGAPSGPVAEPVPGFVVAVTGTGGAAPLPQPRGAVAFTMPDAATARDALDALFPAAARTDVVAGTTARSTRESIPLAGELEVWGAAVGARVVIATGREEIAAIARDGGNGVPAELPAAPWRVETITLLSVTESLPLLRAAAPFLSALVAARYRGAPNLARDLDLLAAVRSVTVLTGSDTAGTRALAAVRVGDLPARP